MSKNNGKSNENPVYKDVTLEQVRDWVKKDLHAAHYFLGLLLSHPEAIQKAADEIYKEVKLREAGTAIDNIEKLNQQENATA